MSLNVRINLENIDFRSNGSGGIFDRTPSADPYLWTVFFKIDDSGDSGEPVATAVGTLGSHGSLDIGSIVAPASVTVPKRIGQWETTLRVLPSKDGTVNDLVGAIVGTVAVLMEEDNVTDDGAEAGRHELLIQVRQAVEDLAADLASAITFNADAFADLVQSRIRAAIRAQQNVLENLWSWLNPDDLIGSMIWYSLASGFDDDTQDITDEWTDLFAKWSLQGKATKFTESRPRINRSSLTFRNARIGVPARRSFSITNYTPLDLTIDLQKSGSPRFRIDKTSLELRQGATAQIQVTFIPTGSGPEAGAITIRRRSSEGVFGTVYLAGTTVNSPPQ